MNSPAAAIAWEIWRKNRWALTGAFAGLPASMLLWVAFRNSIPEFIKITEFFIALLSGTSIFWAFGFTELESRGRHSGFPSRMFVLPVRTLRLVSYPVLYGAGTVILLFLAWLATISIQWKAFISPGAWIPAGAAIVAMLVSMQAIVWAFHRFNWTRMVLLIVVMVAEFTLIVGAALEMNDRPPRVLTSSGLTLVSVFVSACAYTGAVIAVRRDRRGDLLNGLENAWKRFLDLFPHRSKPFASAAGAQFWIEWQRRGWLSACALALLMILPIMLLPTATLLDLDPRMLQLNFCLLPFITLWFAACGGMQLAKFDSWSPDLSLHPIVAARPLTAGNVVIAKLKVAAVITIIAWTICAALSVPATFMVAGLNHLNDQVRFWADFPKTHPVLLKWIRNPIVILAALGLTWHGFVAGMCPVLFGRASKNIWAVGLGLGFFGLVVFIIGWLTHHEEQVPAFLAALPWVTAAWLIWKWAMSAKAFRRICPRQPNAEALGYSRDVPPGQCLEEPAECWRIGGNLYSPKQWWSLFAIWIGLTLLVLTAAALARSANQIPAAIVGFLAVWLLPGPELATCAINLAQNRHR